MRWLTLLLTTMLFACANQNAKRVVINQSQIPPLPFDEELFPQDKKVETLEQVFKLTEAQRADFLSYFNHSSNRNVYPNHRISRYLSDKLKSFNFYSDTLTASQSLSNQLGNCLSLAIVTHALADIAGVKVRYELVKTPAIFQKEGSVVMASQHVQSLLYDPGPGEFHGRGPIWRSYIRVDYYPVGENTPLRKVEKEEFFSMYYRNKAAEALSQNKLELSHAYIKQVLNKNKLDGQAINIMAVLYDRLGNIGLSEKLYQYGLNYASQEAKFDLLYNYHILLTENGRKEDAAKIARKLAGYPDKNPFRWVTKGNNALGNKQYSSAIRFFKKAIKLAEYLHEPYAGIAQAQFALGKTNSAKRALKKAIEKSNKEKTRNIYQLKYDKLVNLNR